MLIIPIVLHEREVPSNATNEELSHTAHDPHHAKTQPEAQNQAEREGQGTGVNRPPEASPEHISGDDHVGEDAHEAVQSGRSRGEFLRPDNASGFH